MDLKFSRSFSRVLKFDKYYFRLSSTHRRVILCGHSSPLTSLGALFSSFRHLIYLKRLTKSHSPASAVHLKTLPSSAEPVQWSSPQPQHCILDLHCLRKRIYLLHACRAGCQATSPFFHEFTFIVLIESLRGTSTLVELDAFPLAFFIFLHFY